MPLPTSLNICVIAGEASGDVQASHVIAAMKKRLSQKDLTCSFWGAAGPSLREQGVEDVVPLEDLAVMGFAEIFENYPRLSGAYKKLRHEIKLRKPLAVILVDYPGFNLRLAQDVFDLGFKVIYHIPPKVWAHGLGRVEILKRCAFLTTCILPFESEFFGRHKVKNIFVGNPLRDAVERFLKSHAPSKSQPEKKVIGLLPGSRKTEILKMLPVFIESFATLQKEKGGLKAKIPVASTLKLDFVKDVARQAYLATGQSPANFEVDFEFVPGGTYSVLSEASYAWVCSGTAALEAAFFGTPMSVAYKVHPVSNFIAMRILQVPYVSLVNLCANDWVIPEFLQTRANVANLTDHAKKILFDDNESGRMRQKLLAIRDMFPLGSDAKAAEAIVGALFEAGAS